jgi:hypothetical protein
MSENQFNIAAARKLAMPHHILTTDIVEMYDGIIRSAISNGQARTELRFQRSRGGYQETAGFPSGMSENRGLELLREHYKSAGFSTTSVKSYSGDQRDPRDVDFSYIEVWGWAP